MKLGTKSRSKKPNCRHFGADGTLEDKYVVVYVEQPPFGYRLHLHCSECNVTAQNALPKKTAEKFDGFGVQPVLLKQKKTRKSAIRVLEHRSFILTFENLSRRLLFLNKEACSACGPQTTVTH